MDGTRKYHPEWGNPFTKEYTWYGLTDKWILAQKLEITKKQFRDQMKLKKKEEQSMDTLVLLRRENKIPTGGDTETKCGAESEGKTIQILPHLGIHPIYSYKTQTLLWMPTSDCWPEPNIAVTWEALLVHDKYRREHSQPATELSTGSPMEDLESKELKGFIAP